MKHTDVASGAVRARYSLTLAEIDDLNRLRPAEGVAFPFWRRIAADRGVDPKTIITAVGNHHAFTALPIGHKKPHWCWPSALTLTKRPVYVENPRG